MTEIRARLKGMAGGYEQKMTTEAKTTPGLFCWVDLAAHDTDGAKEFYQRVFGWEMAEPAGAEMGHYTMLRSGQQEVGGLFQGSPAMGPSSWMSYVLTEDIDEVAGRVESCGGKLFQEPFDVGDYGRMAVVVDNTGALFSLWQDKTARKASTQGAPNTVGWHELLTTNPSLAGDFYGKLFGWTTERHDMPEGAYFELKLGDRNVGGMMKKPDDGLSSWLVYFAVADCDASTTAAKNAGATVQRQPGDIPGVGRFAVLSDPWGAHFAVIKFFTK